MKRLICTFLFHLLLVLQLSSLDFGDMKIKIISTRTEGGQDVVDIIDPYGKPMTLVGTENLNGTLIRKFANILAQFNSWEGLVIGMQRAVITTERIEYAIIPERFVYAGKDIAEHMPSGMQFYYTTFLEYDFRLHTDNLFLRINGQLFDERQFCDELLAALENPLMFIQTRNPDYLIEQLRFISKNMDTLMIKLETMEKESIENIKALKAENAFLKNAVSAFANGGLFKLTAPLSSETIRAVLELKETNPGISKKMLKEILAEKGIALSRKEAAIILAVYFNEY